MGSWFSSSNSNEDNTKELLNGNVSNVSNGSNGSTRNSGSNDSKTKDLDIFKEIKNIYFQRHAVSCANTIEKVYGKGQIEKSKYAANSGISYVGVQQCLQVCDYFSNFRINAENPNGGKKPLIVFCCSELIRTQQTLFLSWLKYLKDYKDNNGRIIVLPWLNEVSLPSKFGIVINKDNFPSSLAETKNAWTTFIENITTNIQRIKDDTLNKESSLEQDIKGFESWDELFYLSPLIFKEGGDPLSNSGKKTPIKRIWEHKKRVGDMNQFIGSFDKILATYIKKQQINLGDYDGIELVLVAHHNSAEHLMKFLLPSTHTQFEEQQLVNCEVVKLPGACLKNPGQNTGVMERIYPTKFNKELNIQINREILEENEKTRSRRERRIFVNPLFILYMSELNLFLSVNNIVKTRLKARFIDKGMKQMGNYVSKERIQVKKPLFKFLFNLSVEDYLEELQNAKVYIQQLQKEYEGKQTFYNYAEMIKKIQEKIGFLESYFKKKGNKTSNIMNQKSQKIQWYIKNNKKNQNQNITMKEEDITKKLKDYLFGFCGLDQPAIDSIAVF